MPEGVVVTDSSNLAVASVNLPKAVKTDTELDEDAGVEGEEGENKEATNEKTDGKDADKKETKDE